MSERQKKRGFFCYNFFSKNNKGIISEYLPWLLIALAVLAITTVTVILLKDKGIVLIDQIKDIFRGR